MRVGSQCGHLIQVRMLTDQIQRLGADGARGTENGNAFHRESLFVC